MKRSLTRFAVFAGILALFTLGAFNVSAQTARVQFIHNAAAVTLSTVDVYANGIPVLDNMVFRTATGFTTLPAGTYAITVNDTSSTDSGTAVLARFNATFGSGSANIIMLAGVDSPANYAVNPDGKATDLRIIHS